MGITTELTAKKLFSTKLMTFTHYPHNVLPELLCKRSGSQSVKEVVDSVKKLILELAHLKVYK